MVPQDRRCYGRFLENPIRRAIFPPHREVDLLAPNRGDSVADLGAGVGYYDVELLRRVGAHGRLWAVDIDPENLGVARRRVGTDPRVDFTETSAARVPHIPSGSVDRALLSLVICCMVDKEGALDEAWRILRPGGEVLVTYPRRRGVRARRRASLRVLPDRWAALQARHAWVPLPVRSSWALQRHLLRRPILGRSGPTPSP
jgi:SAM-dependent methyltransferase